MNPTDGTTSRDYGRFDELAEEFAARYRRGERPGLQEYIDRCPELADEIREMFPALVEVARAEQEVHDAPGPPPPVVLPALGQLGDYRIIREIGRGGMGVVYEAEQVSLGRHVALKLLPPQGPRDADQRRRFEREARAAAKLHHTNIVPVFGVGEHDGTPYYVMQFIRGSGLDEVLGELKQIGAGAPPSTVTAAGREASRRDVSAAAVARSLLTGRFELAGADDESGRDETAGAASAPTLPDNRRPSGSPSPSSSSVLLLGQGDEGTSPSPRKPTYWEGVARIGEQVADALSYAHAQGILHRDIKPSNLLLDPRGTVWVTDFGLAKADDQQDLTHTGDVLGTLRYMPPEAFEGRSGARSDVYSLGMTLYELLAFRPAFDERERGRLIRQVTTEEPPRLGRLNPEVPRDLETIVLKAIDKEPSRRYASAEELAADLRRFLEDRPIRARQVSPAERLLRWGRRNKVVAGLLASLVVTLVAGFIVSTSQWIRAEANAGRLARQLYTSDMGVIQQLYEAGDIVRMGELLKRHIPRLGQTDWRGFEWYVFWRRYQRSRPIRTFRLDDAVWDLEATPDGQTLCAATFDHALDKVRVTIWDAATGRASRTFHGPQGGRPGTRMAPVALSPDGRFFATGSYSDEPGRKRFIVDIRDSVTGETRWSLGDGPDGHTAPMFEKGLAFSADGEFLITGSEDRTINLWDIASEKLLQTFPAPGGEGHSRGLQGVALSPDGRWIASLGPEKSVKLWDVDSREVVHVGECSTIPTSVAFSPDGRYLAVGSWSPGARVWDVSEPRDPREIELRGQRLSTAMSISFSPDGRYLATSNSNLVTLWRVGDGASREWAAWATLKGHENLVWSVAFLDGGRKLASGSTDRTVKLWDITRAGAERDVLSGHTSHVFALAFTPDGQTLLSADATGTIKRWDVGTGREGAPLEAPTVNASRPVFNLAISGRTLVDSSGNRWDLKTDRLLAPLPEQALPVDPFFSQSSFSPDGSILATAPGGTIQLWDVATQEQRRRLTGHTSEIGDLAFSPDGRILASGAADLTVRLWDVSSGEQLAVLDHSSEGHAGIISSVAFSPDGRTLASGSWDRTVKLWDVTDATNPTLRNTLEKHAGMVWSLAFSPDGATLASAGEDGTIRLWDPTTGRERCTLVGHAGKILSLVFSPDGSVLASGDGGGTIRLWRR